MRKAIVSPFLIALITVAIGAISVGVHQAFLTPSLASAAFVQVQTPNQPAARTWNTGIGQLLGVVGAFLGVVICGVEHAPAFSSPHPLLWGRAEAAGIAVLFTAGAQEIFKATSPAGAATALVLALGTEQPTWIGFGRLVCGIVLVVVLGEGARMISMRLQGEPVRLGLLPESKGSTAAKS